MLSDFKIPYTITGHSERRTLCGETSQVSCCVLYHAVFHAACAAQPHPHTQPPHHPTHPNPTHPNPTPPITTRLLPTRPSMPLPLVCLSSSALGRPWSNVRQEKPPMSSPNNSPHSRALPKQNGPKLCWHTNLCGLLALGKPLHLNRHRKCMLSFEAGWGIMCLLGLQNPPVFNMGGL